jgi:hypothetical protein
VQVDVTDVSANKTWFFEADCWLDAAGQQQQKGSSQRAERLLTASCSNPLADRKTFQVRAGN